MARFRLVVWALWYAVATSVAAGPQVDLVSAGTFGVLAKTSITNTGTTVINGDIGVGAALTSITGFPPGNHSGTQSTAGGTTAPFNDATTAKAAIRLQTPITMDLTGLDLGSMGLAPGVYTFSTTAQLTGVLTLTGTGSPNDRWYFRIGTSLPTASRSRVVLASGALACNVFWDIDASATLGDRTWFQGTILAGTPITMTTLARSNGGLIALIGSVTLDTNIVNAPRCPVVVSLSPSSTSSQVSSPSPSVGSTASTASTSSTRIWTLTTSVPTISVPTTLVPTNSVPANSVPANSVLDSVPTTPTIPTTTISATSGNNMPTGDNDVPPGDTDVPPSGNNPPLNGNGDQGGPLSIGLPPGNPLNNGGNSGSPPSDNGVPNSPPSNTSPPSPPNNPPANGGNFNGPTDNSGFQHGPPSKGFPPNIPSSGNGNPNGPLNGVPGQPSGDFNDVPNPFGTSPNSSPPSRLFQGNDKSPVNSPSQQSPSLNNFPFGLSGNATDNTSPNSLSEISGPGESPESSGKGSGYTSYDLNSATLSSESKDADKSPQGKDEGVPKAGTSTSKPFNYHRPSDLERLRNGTLPKGIANQNSVIYTTSVTVLVQTSVTTSTSVCTEVVLVTKEVCPAVACPSSSTPQGCGSSGGPGDHPSPQGSSSSTRAAVGSQGGNLTPSRAPTGYSGNPSSEAARLWPSQESPIRAFGLICCISLLVAYTL